MKKRLFAMLLAVSMLLGLLSGCGGTAASSEAEAKSNTAEAVSEQEVSVAPAEEADTDADQEAEEVSASASEVEAAPAALDFTESNAAMDFSGYKEMLKGLTTELPVADGDVTLSYFFGFEGTTLNYIDGGVMENHQVWSWLMENAGVNLDLKVVNKTNETDQFNLMIASGDYTDIVPAGDYSAGAESAYEEDIFVDLGDYLEENMPNYWQIINSDQKLLSDVQDGDKFLAIYALKDQVANPGGIGTFIRMDWLDDLGLEVPETYDELTDVLRAFKTEKGASEPMALFNTVSMQNGILMGGFGSLAELSANGMGTDFGSSFYQEDGKVIYGATADGTRKFLSWLHLLYTEGLIDFDNMQSRETNPFSDLNAGTASDGTNGYIFTNQPFGGEYSNMAAQNGDDACNWWPVQDVAETAGQTIPFYEEVNLIDMTSLAITSDCENVETALQLLDFGYSYEGALLYNFGFQIGSGHDVETWDYDENGEPVFDEAALLDVAEATNIASGVIATKDLAGIVYDTRLSFSFGDRENACFDAWSTNKTAANILGSSTTLTAEESTDASAIYSDIITYVATAVLQFINGDLDVDDDADWNDYVANIESMNIGELTDIIQTAYDRANG
jgi:putative aldouronate transport system substrate-binding protein